MSWEEVQNQFQCVFAVLSILINSFLIFLILEKSPKRLGTYKYLMVFISIFEIIYSILNVLLLPIFHSYDTSYLVYINLQKFLFNRETALVFIAVYSGCFGFSLAIFGIHFVYRYLAVSGRKRLRYFNSGWKITLWLIIPFSYGFSWAIPTYIYCYPNDEANKYWKNNLLELYDVKLDQVAYLSPLFYQKGSTGLFIGLTVCTFEIISSLVVIVYCGVKCHWSIRSFIHMTNVSWNYAGLQSQLFYALVTQAAIPLVLMHIPVIILIITTLTGKELGMSCGILSITIAFYPAIDPLPTIFIIKSYRKALYGYIGCNCIRNAENGSAPYSQQVHSIFYESSKTKNNSRETV